MSAADLKRSSMHIMGKTQVLMTGNAFAGFLTQATFGPTRETLSSVDATSTASVRAWIDAQRALPPSLHRVYYRRRANPRLLAPLATGGVRGSCSAGSRWHRFSLTKVDEGELLEVLQHLIQLNSTQLDRPKRAGRHGGNTSVCRLHLIAAIDPRRAPCIVDECHLDWSRRALPT